ncbi:MAG: molybdopterin-dependent oxidoreductase, partial [Thermoplasmata archaeon]|nr:molybdopterin-dependent oxidoreductase [Thermoplasmata archaeon]
MKLTRRRLLKGAAVGAGGLGATRYLLRGNDVHGATKLGPAPVEEWVPTTCWIGKQDCGMLARRIDGRIVKFEGNPGHPRNAGKLCPKGMAQIIALYDPNRVKAPLVRTNAKGVSGQWRQVSWETALRLVGDQVKEVRRKDPSLLLFFQGRSKSKAFYDEAFVEATGATWLRHGGLCSDALARATEYTLGLSGGLHPDFNNTRYLLAWGWNITNAGGNKLCWIVWNRQLLAARDKGMKTVVIDPRLRGGGPFADEWLPIRPGTDLALALALCNLVITGGHVDREYLTRYTNAPFLVGPDGHFLRKGGEELVWDPAEGKAKPASAVAKPALEGEYAVDGRKAKPAFQLFKEHVAPYTAARAAEICGISADQVVRVGAELADNAMIGTTTTVDGLQVPYRPVGVMANHVSQQELGFQAFRAVLALFMLVGAVGAVGGVKVDFTWDVDRETFDALGRAKIDDPPYDIRLTNSKFFPISSGSPALAAKVMLDPARYGVERIPEVAIVHM